MGTRSDTTGSTSAPTRQLFAADSFCRPPSCPSRKCAAAADDDDVASSRCQQSEQCQHFCEVDEMKAERDKQFDVKILCFGLCILALCAFLAMFTTLNKGEVVLVQPAAELQPAGKITVKTEGNQWLSKAEIAEMECLARVAAKSLADDEGVDVTLSFHDDSDVDTDIPSVNIASSWAPAEVDVLAEAIYRRLEVAKRSLVIPYTTSASSSSKLLRRLEQMASERGARWRILHPNSTSPKVYERLKEIKTLTQNATPESQTLLVLSSQEELKDILRTASSDFPSFRKMFWIHPNSFNMLSETVEDDAARKFAEAVGLTTFLIFPTQETSDVDLRRLKYTLLSHSCPSSSMHRAAAFVKTLKSVLRNDGNLPESWEVWNLFLTGHDHQATRLVQGSPWVVGEVLTADGAGFAPSKLGHLAAEVVRKHELVDVYARAATECAFLETISLKNRDLFSLEPVEFVFTPDGFPEAAVIPQNHGFSISLKCEDPKEKGAEITCGDDAKSPCVHSAFRKRSKRGLAEARKVLATINARRVKYVIENPEEPEEDVDGESGGADNQIQRRLGAADTQNNGTGRIPVPYRIRQKAIVIYKIFHDEGLSKEQMTEILEEAVPHPVIRKEVEYLIQKLPDNRANFVANRDGAAKPKYPVPPFAKWLGGSAGPVAGCIGTSTAVLLCSMIAEASTNPAVTGGCHANGFQQIGGSCQFMMGRLFQVIFEDQSVICSALHEKGLLGDFAFAVDSAFGRRLAEADPLALQGYHLLAAPVVEVMKRSETVSKIVSRVSRPWIDQMMFQSGFKGESDTVGSFIMNMGLPLARMVGSGKQFVARALEPSLWIVNQQLVFSFAGTIFAATLLKRILRNMA